MVAALDYHSAPVSGKRAVVPTKPLANARDLALADHPIHGDRRRSCDCGRRTGRGELDRAGECSSIPLEHSIQGLQQEIHFHGSDGQRRADLENVHIPAGGADQDAGTAQAVDDP